MNYLRQSKALKAILLLALLCLFVACSDEITPDSVSEESAPPAPSASLETPDIVNYDINPLTGRAPVEVQTEGTRPIAVMVDNITAALPQTGISLADVIYEAETEGGITRLMALFSDPNAITAIGPVRSVRSQFAELAMAQNAILVNIGSSSYAEDLLNYFGYQNVDGIYLGETAFKFDALRADTAGNQHAWYTDSTKIAAGIASYSIPTTGGYYPLFNFSENDTEVIEVGKVASLINFRFSTVAAVEFAYNGETGLYQKNYNGAPQIDVLDNAQLAFDNLFVLFCDVTLEPDGYVTNFALTQGEGVYINGGKYIDITWQKGDPDDQLKVFGEDGEEITVAQGKSYIAMVAKSRQGTLTIS